VRNADDLQTYNTIFNTGYVNKLIDSTEKEQEGRIVDYYTHILDIDAGADGEASDFD
jgi:uncharacterized membrane protein